ALQCGRDISLAPYGDVEEDGIYSVLNSAGFTKSVVLGTHLGHYSLVKAMGLLGMGRSGYIQISTDDQQRLNVRELRCQLERCRQEKIHVAAIVGIAGTTECGSFDPLDEMADLAEEFGIYFHVDAAWGGALMFSDEHKHLLKGVKRADSVTIDGHKQLYLPMGIGVLLFKTPEKASHVSTEADYIIRKNSQDLGRVSIEGSRPAKVFYLQAALKLFGKSGYGEILDGCILVARNLSHYIDQSSEFELLTTPQSNIFLYRYIPRAFRNMESSEEREQAINDFNIRLQEAQKHRGKTFVSRTKFMSPKINESLVALRVVIANPLSSLEHCKEVLRDQLQLARELEKSI
ncbi:MAG: aminotransferase class V-fold PLP-dependent enzyme, partial [Lentisphaeraceae bacterium]|nr:aminotransferase class V-fold PLP-dependent enzyme [Lentisphaeraceae bacterium]